jgi:hypothetical protein
MRESKEVAYLMSQDQLQRNQLLTELLDLIDIYEVVPLLLAPTQLVPLQSSPPPEMLLTLKGKAVIDLYKAANSKTYQGMAAESGTH